VTARTKPEPEQPVDAPVDQAETVEIQIEGHLPTEVAPGVMVELVRDHPTTVIVSRPKG
jgi:hypothetical protein